MKNLERVYLNWELRNEAELIELYNRLRRVLERFVRYSHLLIYLACWIVKKLWILLMVKPSLIKTESPYFREEVSLPERHWLFE